MSNEVETTFEETVEQQVEGTDFGGDVLDTPSLALPKKTPEIHEGVVQSVTTKVGKDSGNSYGVITLQSKNNGLIYELGFFPPQAWFDPENWTPNFNPDTLSDEVPAGKKLNPKQLYAMNVSNTDADVAKDGSKITGVIGKEAPLQLLRKLAVLDGLTLDSSVPRPTNGTEYIGVINSLVAGRLDVLFTLTPKKDDANPQFDGQLKVNRILAKTDVEKPNFDKRFQEYRKAWEV